MGKIYSDQDYLKIELSYTDTIEDEISGIAIEYKKPDGTEGQWDAVHDEEAKTIYKIFDEGEYLDVTGNWRFRPVITFTDGRVMPGEAVSILVSAKWVI